MPAKLIVVGAQPGRWQPGNRTQPLDCMNELDFELIYHLRCIDIQSSSHISITNESIDQL